MSFHCRKIPYANHGVLLSELLMKMTMNRTTNIIVKLHAFHRENISFMRMKYTINELICLERQNMSFMRITYSINEHLAENMSFMRKNIFYVVDTEKL